jgi:Flp pilus assembly pilin Flp
MGFLMVGLCVKLRCLMHDEEGQDLVEYGLIIGLLALGCMAAMQTVSEDVLIIYNGIKNAVASA